MATYEEMIARARELAADGRMDDARRLGQMALASRKGASTEGQPASAREQAISQGFTPIATSGDGEIMENLETGAKMFVSPGFVTQNQETIAGMMEGSTPAEQWKSETQKRIIAESPIASRGAVALQGVPFIGSYTDEAIGAVSPQAGENVRSAIEAVRTQEPKTALGLEVAGGLAATPALIAAAPASVAGFVGRGASTAGQMMRGAVLGAGAGAAEGAISGLGRGEGSIAERAPTSATGALIGGGAGGVIGAAAPALSAGIKAAWNNIKGRSPKQIANALGISDDAAKVVRNALENDDLTAAQEALQRAGSSSMLADAGPGTQQLLDVSITSGSKAPRVARGAVTQRAAAEADRMNAVMDNILGAPEGIGTMQRGIRQGTQQARQSAYDAAYSAPINYAGPRGRTLEGMLTRIPRSAINQANELMRLEGVTSGQILADVAEDGTVAYRRLPDVRQLDYIARALGDVSEQQSALGKLGGTTQLGRATGNLQKQIRGVLRQEVPEYGRALDTAADAISRTRAVETGADVLRPSVTRDAVEEGLRGASRAERSAARAGLRSAIDENLARVNAVASDPNVDIREFQKLANTLRSRSARDKMGTVLGERDAARLYDELDKSVVSLELRAAVSRNSATQQRQAIQGAVEDVTSPGILPILVSEGQDAGPINAIKRLVAVITGNTNEARAVRQAGIYDEIAETLTSLRGSQAQQALRLVEKAMAGEALTDTQARVISRALTTPAAMAAYGISTTPLEE